MRPENPAGPYVANPSPTEVERTAMLSTIRHLPTRLRSAISSLNAQQLQMKYRNWTLQQIVNHLADSHINAFIRFRLTLTEDRPTIKPYNETAWSALEETKTTDVQTSLQLLDALHQRWCSVLEQMKPEEYSRTYYHPEYKTVVSLGEALGVYAWHCSHHLAQIELVRGELGK